MYDKKWYERNKDKFNAYVKKWRRLRKYGTIDEEEIKRQKILKSFKRVVGEDNFPLFSLDNLTTYELSCLLKRASELKRRKKAREEYARCSICEEFREKQRKRDKKYYYKSDNRKNYQREKQREYKKRKLTCEV